MSFFVNQILEIELPKYSEQVLDLNVSNSIIEQLMKIQNESQLITPPYTVLSQKITSWSISAKLQGIINQFEDTILYQFLYILCSICSKLIYPEK
ncbi:3594_t:CDS:1, partial [Cetraspora pellucida]